MLPRPGAIPLIARLARRKRGRRRVRYAAVFSLGLGASAILLATGRSALLPPQEASSFVLRDAQGRSRAELRLRDGGPELVFIGENGETRMLMGLGSLGNANIEIYDERPKLRYMVSVGNHGAFLTLHDSQGRPQAQFAIDEDGPGISLRQPGGTIFWHVEPPEEKAAPANGAPPTSPAVAPPDMDPAGKAVLTAPPTVFADARKVVDDFYARPVHVLDAKSFDDLTSDEVTAWLRARRAVTGQLRTTTNADFALLPETAARRGRAGSRKYLLTGTMKATNQEGYRRDIAFVVLVVQDGSRWTIEHAVLDK